MLQLLKSSAMPELLQRASSSSPSTASLNFSFIWPSWHCLVPSCSHFPITLDVLKTCLEDLVARFNLEWCEHSYFPPPSLTLLCSSTEQVFTMLLTFPIVVLDFLCIFKRVYYSKELSSYTITFVIPYICCALQ